MLLDVCGTAKDALSQTKECTLELQSTLRRRRGVEGFTNEVRKYLTSRKAVKKAICKALKNLKHMENKLSSSSFSRDGESGAVINTLKQVEAVTVRVLESLLSFISGPEAESKLSRWSQVSKFMYQKRVVCEEEEQKANEIVNAEATLSSLIKSEHVENVQNVQNSVMCIEDLNEGLESLFRRFIKARVAVLNSLINC
ncbi:putative Eukaryotic translation initiation factor 3 subunit A [Hibiscus syriacus]|uniref:Eukaryotic translation initiation factor 3 subunit A n=2 Tax=Hibiscus syriacus TaxID=106335 RepID=A0A6A2ZB76_HIBSY|nr:putative Eukaryotic translation initiation factor 3 subunit A [Hibiscus syriacus]